VYETHLQIFIFNFISYFSFTPQHFIVTIIGVNGLDVLEKIQISTAVIVHYRWRSSASADGVLTSFSCAVRVANLEAVRAL
jgi:hypothetical protein